MVGSTLQHACTSGKEETGEVVPHHEVGTWMRTGVLIPKEADDGQPAVDSGSGLPAEQHDGGDLWTTPREEARTTGLVRRALDATPRGEEGRRRSDRHPNRSSSRRTGSCRESRREGQEGTARFPQKRKPPPKHGSSKAVTSATAGRATPRRTAAKANEPHHVSCLPSMRVRVPPQGRMSAPVVRHEGWTRARVVGGSPLIERAYP